MVEFSPILKFILSKLFYPSFTFGLTPRYPIYKIIPWPVILISILGIYLIFRKKKWLVFQIIAGGIFWLLYSFLDYRFIIEYQRAVFFTSLLLIVVSGFGLQKLVDYLKEKAGEKITLYLELGIIVLFLAFTPFYTQRENWKEFILLDLTGSKVFPKAPANMYLTEDDLRIFKDIKGKKFLSSPWKGTVIAIATDNEPATTKAGTITINPDIYFMFINSDCQGKRNFAKGLDYVYSLKFDCQGFEKIEESKEGFVLYRVNK